ncbi:MAG: acyl-CoA desaturase [Phycisphaerales bacterium]
MSSQGTAIPDIVDILTDINAPAPKPATPTEHPADPTPSWSLKLVNGTVVVIPFLGLVAAAILLWGVAFDWIHLALFVGMYLLTGLGITVGFHRLFTHRSFKTYKVVSATLAILGSMAFEGPLLRWVATHRRHHQVSDKHGDPHSPHTHGDGLWPSIKGAFHSHMGWLFDHEVFTADTLGKSTDAKDPWKYVKDLYNDPVSRVVSKTFLLWAMLGLAIPALIGGLATMSWMGALLGFIWGGLVRVFFVHHVTWSINSVCHLWGSRPFRSHDESRNNPLFGVIGFGEGWHNNHHAFPASARHGLRWWEFDASYLIIRVMRALRLVYDIKVPSAERIAAQRADARPTATQPPSHPNA